MCRKMKSIIMLFIVLGMIYCRQPAFAGDAYAKEEYSSLEEIENKIDIGEEDSIEDNSEKDTGKEDSDQDNSKKENDEKDSGDEGYNDEIDDNEEVDDNEKEEPSEKIECFRYVIPKEDGENGYYVSKPEVEICHVSKEGITRYSFISSSGQKDEGVLEQSGDKVRIGKEKFQEGVNRLLVWMENEDREKVEGYEFEKLFLIDTQAPVFKIQTPKGLDVWYQGEVFISVSGEDGEQGSQVEEVACYQGKQKIGESQKAPAGFRISLASVKGKAVPVTVRISDKAGNCAEETYGLYIDRQPPRINVEGADDYMITSRPLEVNYHVEDENAVEKMRAGASREDPQGEVTFLEAEDWEVTDTEGKACQILEEDGIYRIEVEALDKSGYGNKSTCQVIIDSESPVIQSVDEINGQYMKNFCWNMPVQEVIKDFTSYTYAVYLDGKTYHMGENVTSEGSHVLEVKAVDAAGNEGMAKADFVIDHTAPAVVFKDIEEGAEYKKEKTFEILLENPEDYVREICINGEKQKVDPGNKKYQYYVRECKNYEISVKAYDQAGNQTVSRMNFKVVKEETLLHKVAGPILKALAWPLQSEKEGQEFNENKQKERRTNPMVLLLVIGIITAGGVGIYIVLQSNGFVNRNREYE